MTFRSRLLAIGVPLVVLPVAASLLVFSLKMAETDELSRFRILEGQLSLVSQHVETAWGVLSKVGFENNEFYQRTVGETIQTRLAAFSGPGEGALILDATGTVFLGPPGWRGRTIGAGDPWKLLLEQQQGAARLDGGAFSEGRATLVAFRRFSPWSWVVVTYADEEQVWKTVTQSLVLSSGGSLVFLVLAILGFWFFARQVSRPLVELQSLVRRMGQGQFDLRARGGGLDETMALAREWNAMVDRVKELTTGLELRVAERTQDLAQALEQTKTMQGQLILSEKMASLGQLVAGIAHELNTPLGAIASAQRTLDEVVSARWPLLLEALATLPPAQRTHVTNWLVRSATAAPPTDTVTRRRVRKQLTARLEAVGALDPTETSERLVEVGLIDWSDEDLALLAGPEGQRLASAVADLALAQLSSRLIGLAAAKADRVIGALRIYSRHDTSRESTRIKLVDSLDSVLTLFQSRLRGIEVVRKVPLGLTLTADGDRIGQLWANLISNALAAMGNAGRLEIGAHLHEGFVVVQVIDNGPGIPEDLQHRVFTPFFTTKKAGEGSGLGLSICQTIVQEAGGTLTFQSRPGHTVFEVRLPCP